MDASAHLRGRRSSHSSQAELNRTREPASPEATRRIRRPRTVSSHRTGSQNARPLTATTCHQTRGAGRDGATGAASTIMVTCQVSPATRHTGESRLPSGTSSLTRRATERSWSSRRDFRSSAGKAATSTQSSPRGVRNCLRIVQLVPRIQSAAPITIAWTGFPGLHVRVGRWHVEAFPHCGCDACDEDPADLVGELRKLVDAVVEGGLMEWCDGRRLGYELSYRGGHRAGEGLISEEQRPSVGEAERHPWDAWPPRGE